MRLASIVKFTLISLLTVSFGPQADQTNRTDSKVSVSIMTVQYQQHAKSVIASGSVRPESEQRLAFKVPGIIDKVLVKEGVMVTKGQVLAILVLAEVDAQVIKARAVLKDAQSRLARVTELRGRQLASQEQSSQVQTAVEVARSDLQIAVFNRQYSQITAPADGRILTRYIEPNELIQSGQQAFVFADVSQGWTVQLSVADVDIVKLQLGDSATVKLDAYPGETFSANISEIAGRANPTSLTFEVDLHLNNPPLLYSGLVAHTDISPSQKRPLSAIPLTALLEANGSDASLYVINQLGHAELRSIKMAYLDGRYAMVSAGLSDGEQIVVNGGPYIVDGAQINIINDLSVDTLQASAQ